MKTKNGLFVGLERTFSNNGPSNHTWVLASRHYPWSITWSWALYWTKPMWLGCGSHFSWLKTLGFWFRKQDEMPWPVKLGHKEDGEGAR